MESIMKLEYTVKQNDNYTNLKELLKAYFNISDRLLLKLKKNNCILLNGSSPLYISKELDVGDHIEVTIDFEEDNSNIVPVEMSLNILYEDEYYLVVNKSPGMPVHPSMLHYPPATKLVNTKYCQIRRAIQTLIQCW